MPGGEGSSETVTGWPWEMKLRHGGGPQDLWGLSAALGQEGGACKPDAPAASLNREIGNLSRRMKLPKPAHLAPPPNRRVPRGAWSRPPPQKRQGLASLQGALWLF